ncbi:AAA family ATPase [Prevotella multiformis]|uniref:AAA family ATPase n=1 Tax=Prevotella multiformis TaxID=282402 RepID=UPI001BAB1B77|nr:AAA family ATPase [Prevotella multiformis]QUB70816.1 AAA family ATPase [Prevotella multiformis]
MEAIYSKIKDMLKAYYPVLYLTSFEYDRTKQKIEGIINILKSEGRGVRLFNWNCVSGLRDLSSDKPLPVINKDDEEIVEPEEVLKYILNDKDTSKDVFVLEDFNNYIEEENVKYYIRSIAERARHTNTHAIILSAVYKLPVELEKYVTVLNIPLPNRLDMEKTLGVVERQCKINLSVEMRNRMVDAALGMTSMEADLAFCLAAVKDDFGQNAPYTVSSEKEQIIKKSGILDYFPKNESLKDVGGMEVLKDWLFKRQKAYEKKARDFGLQEPKGLLLLGVPGCGKSLTAKSIASFWNMPLLRLDIGKVYQGLVGSSEDNIRKAIATAEAVAPCVLWIDEIEKGLSGVQSSGSTDGGVTSRIFSTILTWMQEKTSPVFVVATANNINLLPPELLRKGRFDEMFFVDLPSQQERENIFSIHLKKKGQDPSQYPMEMLGKKTEGFNGAEIEECIKEAMFAAYVEAPDEPKLLSKHLMDAIAKTVPLSTTMKEQIAALRNWAATRAKNASSESIAEEKKEMPILLTRPELALERSFDLNTTKE